MSLEIELADGLFVLSDLVPVGSRSWLPPDAKGVEPFNKYLFRTDDAALLVDTGLAIHRGSVLASLERLVGRREFTVLVSRSELECLGNLGAVIDRYPHARALGIAKNLPLLGLAHYSQPLAPGREAQRIQAGRSLSDYGFDNITPVEPLIRTLSTIWISDAGSGALLTSDFFSADLLADALQSLVRKDVAALPSVDYLRRHITTKFDWLSRADCSELKVRWDMFFATTHPAILAPGLGRILQGRNLVQQVIVAYSQAIFRA